MKWWAYVILGIVLFGFAAPALISAADTVAVLVGVMLIVLYGVWTWKLWVHGLVQKLKKEFSL